MDASKTDQLQIRVTAGQKRAIRQAAQRAGMGMSEWLLARALPAAGEAFRTAVEGLASARDVPYVLAELNDLLDSLSARELETATSEPPKVELEPLWRAYLAAMVEYAAARKGAAPPAWTEEVPPVGEPYFGTDLLGLRAHLLTRSPPPFRRRNIFIDASVGDRV